MAARKTAKTSEETLVLPPITSNVPQPKQNVGKTFGNFGSYILLPSLDRFQNMNAVYDVRKFCKVLCEWYITWRIWQREVLLCSLSEKCSVNLLTSLSTILEPVFHRDFVSRLRGKYPDLKPKVNKRSNKKNHRIEISLAEVEGDVIKSEVAQKKSKANEVTEANADAIINKGKVDGKLDISHEAVRKVSNTVVCDKGIQIPIQQWEGITQLTADDKATQNQNTIEKSVSPLADLIKESLLKGDDDAQKVVAQSQAARDAITSHAPFQKKGAAYECRSCHVHTANVYNPDNGSRFFSATRFKKLSDMKANFSRSGRSEPGPVLSEMDQKCFKHRRWWSANPSEKRLVAAQGLNLWKYFTRQLKEVNEAVTTKTKFVACIKACFLTIHERMEAWGDHERVNVISEVIKSSDPEQINFFAQCLIQRLKDHTDLRILPDQTLLKIFSKLDARTLCQISRVSRRWRYLAEDGELWKNKCLELGLSNRVNNLVFLIEKAAENRKVDWKQAYQEVCLLFQQLKIRKKSRDVRQELEEEELEVSQSTSTSSESHCSLPYESERVSEQNPTSPGPETADIHLEYLEMTSNSENDALTESLDAEDDRDLTGGNLGTIEDAVSDLNFGKQAVNTEEIAYDIRPNKLQPRNEMEDLENGKHQLITVGVEDVKSVKRVRKLQGHLDGVYTVQFDTKRCLTGSADRLLRMWDVRSGRAISAMTGHLGGVRCSQFDNEKIVSGSWDTTIIIWDIVKFNCIGILRGHQGCVSCLRFNSTHLVSGSHDMTARVWNVDTWECLRVLEGHTGEVNCLFLGGTHLLTGSSDKTVKLWNIESGVCLNTFVGHNSPVFSIQACRALVISGSKEGKIIFWDAEQGSPVAIIQAHDGPCNCLFIWGSHFLSGGGDALVKQWDISTMTCLRTLQGHKGPVQCIKMSWSKIISSSEDGTVRIWDLEAPIHKLGPQYDEMKNLLLPFDTLEHDDGTT